MLDKKRASRKIGRSAHPVLWICRTFSTVELVLHANKGLQDANAVAAATLASRYFCRQRAVEQWLRLLRMRQCPASFFLQTKERSRRAGFAVDRCRASCPSLVNLDRKKG
jgi:hypothetical protein